MHGRLVIICMMLASMLYAMPVLAQTYFPPSGAALLLSINPGNPEPGEKVEVTLASPSLDLTDAIVAWYVDDTVFAGGVGVTRTTVTVAASGEATHVAAFVTKGDQGIGQADIYIRPADVDLLWEANSLIPPLYKGKRLASPHSLVTVEAHARLTDEDGNLLPEGAITYTWRRNGALVKEASGRGKKSVKFPAPLLFGTDTINVVVSAGTAQAEKSISIPSVDPFAILYQDHSLFGVLYNMALGRSVTLPESEVTVTGFPLFAPRAASAKDRSLQYSWRVNGKSVPLDQKNPQELTINAENSSGVARVEVAIAHLIDILMNANGRSDLLLNAGLGGSAGKDDPFAPDTSL